MKYPNLRIPTIHVTGTNGKGSVVRKIGASLIAAGTVPIFNIYIYGRLIGYKVGEYTSPGMLTEREDFRMNGNIISQGDFVKHHQLCMRNIVQLYKTGKYRKLGTNPVIYIYIYIYSYSFVLLSAISVPIKQTS